MANEQAGKSAPRPEPDLTRPAVLADLSTTQLDELERQFAEQDRQAWGALTRSYGWTPEQAEAVWAWFVQRPDRTGSGQRA